MDMGEHMDHDKALQEIAREAKALAESSGSGWHIGQLYTRLGEIAAAVADTRSKLGNLPSRLATVETTIGWTRPTGAPTLNERICNITTDHEERLERLEARLSPFYGRLPPFQGVDAFSTAVQPDARQAALSHDAAQLESRVHALEAACDRHVRSRDDLARQLEEAVQASIAKDKRIADLEATSEILRQKLLRIMDVVTSELKPR